VLHNNPTTIAMSSAYSSEWLARALMLKRRSYDLMHLIFEKRTASIKK